MKKILVFVFVLIATSFLPCFAQDTIDKTFEQTSVPYTNYRECIREYKLSFAKLYYLALSSVNANKYEILEMQSRNGYVIFKTDNKEFMLHVMKKDKYFAYLKLVPCDNNYYFSPTIPKKIFNYVDLGFNEDIKELKM